MADFTLSCFQCRKITGKELTLETLIFVRDQNFVMKVL